MTARNNACGVWIASTPTPGSPHSLLPRMVAIPSWTRKSILRQLHAFLVSLSTIILSRVLFASNLWMYWAIMLCAARRPRILLPDTPLVQAGGIGGIESADGETGVVGPYG